MQCQDTRRLKWSQTREPTRTGLCLCGLAGYPDYNSRDADVAGREIEA